MGSSELSNKVFGYAERNVASAFEFAERLVQVRDFQSLIRVQTDFIQAQMQAMTEQAKEMSAPKPTQSTGSKGESALPMMMSHAIPAIVAIALSKIMIETNADIAGIFGAGCGS